MQVNAAKLNTYTIQTRKRALKLNYAWHPEERESFYNMLLTIDTPYLKAMIPIFVSERDKNGETWKMVMEDYTVHLTHEAWVKEYSARCRFDNFIHATRVMENILEERAEA